MNKFRLLVAILLFANCGLLLAATPDPGIENGLIDALRFDKSSSTRVANSEKAIRAYKRAKIVNHRPEQRAD